MTTIQPDPAPKKAAAADPAQQLIGQRTTYILVPNDEHEWRIVRHYIATKYGDDFRAQVVRAVPFMRLTEMHTVWPICRKKLRPINIVKPGPGNVPESYPLTDDELAEDVVEREAVRVAGHWADDQHSDIGGVLRQDTFFEALNKRISPFHVQYRSDEGLLRIGLV